MQVLYAWSTDNVNKPDNQAYKEAEFTGTMMLKETEILSDETEENDYYLYITVITEKTTIEEKYGPYSIKAHTMLKTVSMNDNGDSDFLGLNNVPRNMIKEINIMNSKLGNVVDNINYFNITADSYKENYIAWYDKDDNGYYTVNIAGDGGIVANVNSQMLFAYIGANVKDNEVTINGLENLDTGLTTSMVRMFMYSSFRNLNLSSWDVSKVNNIVWMLHYVPTSVMITTNKNVVTWLNTNFPTYTNIKILNE